MKQKYIISQNLSKTDGLAKSTTEKVLNKQIPKETWVKINELQLFVGSIFTGCSMPPLDQFLQLQYEEDEIKLNLINYKTGLLKDEQQNNYIYYLFSGKLYLKKKSTDETEQEELLNTTQRIISASSISSNKLKKTQVKTKQKAIQIKQDSFFMLPSFKKVTDVEYFDIVGFENGEYDRCLIGKIKINPAYNFAWYLAQSQKHQFLSTFFQSEELQVSEHKLKGLSRFFKFDVFRRGAYLSVQNQQNQRLFLIKSGQVQFCKSFSFDQKNHSNKKIIKVANGEPRAVIGSQFALFDFFGASRSVTVATRAMSDIQNQIKRLNFKMQITNINNFSVTVLSAYVHAYYISVQKFKQLCTQYVPQVPQNLRKNIEGNYITLLRTTKQKLELQLIKISKNQNTTYEQRALIEAKLSSGHFQHQLQGKDDSGRKSPIRVKKSQFIQTNLQQEQVEKMRTKRLEKKIQLLLDSDKTKVNYKKKIQIVLKQKLAASRVAQSPQFQKSQNPNASPGYSPIQKLQMKKDLHQIFTNSNSEDKYRSNNIEKQSQILAKKQFVLQKRYSSSNNMLIVHKDFYDKDKNKRFRMDLIRRGALEYTEDNKNSNDKNRLSMKQLSDRIKKDCLLKINKANKIKEQFMTIRSECQHCHCYDDIQSYINNGGIQNKDIKGQTMRTGMAWRRSQSQVKYYEEPLQKLHSRNKLISEKAARKYHHNTHLHSKKKRFASSQKRLSGLLI